MIVRLASQEPDSPGDAYWDDMRNRDYSKSFPAVRDFIHQHSGNMKGRHRRRNRIAWASTVLFALLIFFACRRQTFLEPQGSTMSFIAKDSAQSAIEFAIQQYADQTWRVKFQPSSGTVYGTISASSQSFEKLKSFAEHLKTIKGVTEFHLSALSTSIKESPASRLSYKIFDEHLDAKQLKKDQLIAEIEKKLTEIGDWHGTTQLGSENGKMVFRIEPNGKNPGIAIDFELSDGTRLSAVTARW